MLVLLCYFRFEHVGVVIEIVPNRRCTGRAGRDRRRGGIVCSGVRAVEGDQFAVGASSGPCPRPNKEGPSVTTTQAPPFFEQPILNSPYEEPARHHPLDAEGQPLNEPPREGRRKSERPIENIPGTELALICRRNLVGAARFELATPSPPDWCANRAALRSDPRGIRVFGVSDKKKGASLAVHLQPFCK